jgi:hypothetical protein
LFGNGNQKGNPNNRRNRRSFFNGNANGVTCEAGNCNQAFADEDLAPAGKGKLEELINKFIISVPWADRDTLFRLFDLNGDGVVRRDEFKAVMRIMRGETSP